MSPLIGAQFTAASTPLPVEGTVVADRYRVERLLGEGGMGLVVSARDLQLGRTVALKFLSPKASDAPDTCERFHREARAVASMRSEHVARILDIGTLPCGAPYLVFEHLTGRDLKQVLAERGRLPIEEALEYVAQACEGMADAHALGVVHRDLKPSNLFLTRDADGAPLVKVLDFGISKLPAESLHPNLTSSRFSLGSPQYMSPEQIEEPSKVDRRADLWSLGVILYELVTGRGPFQAASTTGLFVSIATRAPTPIATHRSDVPPALESIIFKCLEKKQNRRWPDAASLARALRAVAADMSSGTAPDPRGPASGSPVTYAVITAGAVLRRTAPRRRRALTAGVAAGMIATGAFIASHPQNGSVSAAYDTSEPQPTGAPAAAALDIRETAAPAAAVSSSEPRETARPIAPKTDVAFPTPPVARKAATHATASPTNRGSVATPAKRGTLDPLADRK
jgi:serine/threonine-protein kinase